MNPTEQRTATHGERLAGAIQAAWSNRVDVTVFDAGCVECRVMDRWDAVVAALTFIVVDDSCPYSNDVGAWIAINTMDDTLMNGDRPFGVDAVTADVVWAVSCVGDLIERNDAPPANLPRIMHAKNDAPLRVCVDTPEVIGFEVDRDVHLFWE